MKRFLRRFAWSLFVIWATVSIAFLVNHALPSDPARMIAGPQAPPEALARVRKDLGLDRPLYVQYTLFWHRLVHLGEPRPSDASVLHLWQKEHPNCATMGPLHVDLGRSYQQRRPVVDVLVERAPRTFLLAAAAALVQALFGVTSGVVAAARKKTWLDRGLVALGLLGISAPTFILGVFLQWLFAYRLHVLPLDGFGRTLGEHASSLTLPALTLGIYGAASYTRFVRDEMIAELDRDYIRTARAKGASGPRIVLRHALRNAMMPIATLFGLEVGTLVGGAVVTETLFRWPGLGSLAVTSMLDRDGPITMGCVIVTSSVVVLSTIAVDIAYVALDPRLRRQG